MVQELVVSRRNPALWWIVANAVGWAGAMGVFEALPDNFATIGCGCAIVGTTQWLALRSQLRVSLWWMVGTSLAWFGTLYFLAPTAGVFDPHFFWLGGIGGTLAGISQCWTLWRRASRPLLWVPVSTVASVAGWFAGVTVGWKIFSHVGDLWSVVIGGAIGGFVIGVLSAPGLIWTAASGKCNFGSPRAL
jgi:hypothetical protein